MEDQAAAVAAEVVDHEGKRLAVVGEGERAALGGVGEGALDESRAGIADDRQLGARGGGEAEVEREQAAGLAGG